MLGRIRLCRTRNRSSCPTRLRRSLRLAGRQGLLQVRGPPEAHGPGSGMDRRPGRGGVGGAGWEGWGVWGVGEGQAKATGQVTFHLLRMPLSMIKLPKEARIATCIVFSNQEKPDEPLCCLGWPSCTQSFCRASRSQTHRATGTHLR